MYNAEKIKQLQRKYQDKIDDILRDAKSELDVIVKEELRKGDKLIAGMGTLYLENKNGKQIENEFTSSIISLMYDNCLETGICPRDINK